jgi:NAD(P)-dependent dehydrogenase (short-subunit alcohol dehydrogenase family)
MTPSVDDMPTAIITGASRGLGLELARVLVKSGWEVIADARTPFTEPGVTVLTGDVTDPAHRAELIGATHHLDLLVNNAGALGPSPLPSVATVDPAALRDLYEVNVLAPLALTQLALPLLRRSAGTIINITSDAAVEAYEGWGAYGSSKAALEHLGRVLAAELATDPPGGRVTVWQVDPGDLRTRMHQDAFPGEDISDRPPPETVAPALLKLLAQRPESGRHKLADWA